MSHEVFVFAQQMSEDEHGLESVSAWIETKLRVRYLIVLLTPLRHVYRIQISQAGKDVQ